MPNIGKIANSYGLAEIDTNYFVNPTDLNGDRYLRGRSLEEFMPFDAGQDFTPSDVYKLDIQKAPYQITDENAPAASRQSTNAYKDLSRKGNVLGLYM